MKLVKVQRYRPNEDDEQDTDSFSINPSHIVEIGRTPNYVTYILLSTGVRCLVMEPQHEIEDVLERG